MFQSIPANDCRAQMFERARKMAVAQRFRRATSMALLLLSLFMMVFGSTCYVLRQLMNSYCLAIVHFACSSGKNTYRIGANVVSVLIGVMAITYATFHMCLVMLTLVSGHWGAARRNSDGSFPISIFILTVNLGFLILTHLLCLYESIKSTAAIWVCQKHGSVIARADTMVYAPVTVDADPASLPAYATTIEQHPPPPPYEATYSDPLYSPSLDPISERTEEPTTERRPAPNKWWLVAC